VAARSPTADFAGAQNDLSETDTRVALRVVIRNEIRADGFARRTRNPDSPRRGASIPPARAPARATARSCEGRDSRGETGEAARAARGTGASESHDHGERTYPDIQNSTASCLMLGGHASTTNVSIRVALSFRASTKSGRSILRFVNATMIWRASVNASRRI